MPPKNEAVKVAVRCRPFTKNETRSGDKKIVLCDTSRKSLVLKNPNGKGKDVTFTFDAVYGPESTQEDVYKFVEPLVKSVLDGINATIFAYGQTGTGKTYTMDGVNGNDGVIWKALYQIFEYANGDDPTETYKITASYMEIYGECIRDLLVKNSNKKCEIRQKKDGGVQVDNLTKLVCTSVKQLVKALEKGSGRRATAPTDMNDVSSRSHAVLQVVIRVQEKMDNLGLNMRERTSKLNLVDLAGSERQGKTNAEGQRLREAAMTNKSLSCLGNVISALASKKKKHIPYRDSKLTRILEDSLGGNAKTLVFANVGPASYNYDETNMTLMYARRAKKIKNRPKKNEKKFGSKKDPLLDPYREIVKEIRKIRDELFKKNKMLLAFKNEWRMRKTKLPQIKKKAGKAVKIRRTKCVRK